jgi:hypothetical protein
VLNEDIPRLVVYFRGIIGNSIGLHQRLCHVIAQSCTSRQLIQGRHF